MSLEQQKAAVVGFSHKIARREWVANHDGNVSLRLGEGRFLATPTATHKAEVDHAGLIVVDESGAVLEGTKKIFGEWELHRAIYAARPEVMAVIHAHPPYATAAAVAGVSLEVPIMGEAVVSLGMSIPTIPFFAPKDAAGLAQLSALASAADVMLLAHHGAIACGPTLELAYLRLELLEHQAKIRHLAQAWGGARPLPSEVLPALLQAREKAGLLTPGERRDPTNSEDLLSDRVARLVIEELRSL